MPQLRPDDSIALIESTGFLAAARLAQAIASESRASIIGVSPMNPSGIITTVIAGSLADVQYALQIAKVQDASSDSLFLARPNLDTLELLLSSIMSPLGPSMKQAIDGGQQEQIVRTVVSPASTLSSRERPKSPQREIPTPTVAYEAFHRKSLLELDEFNVHELRRYARAIPGFPIAGRAISIANRAELMQMIKSHDEGAQTAVANQSRQSIAGILPS